MTTGTAHAKRPFVGGGAFKDRDLANRALESEKRLRELMSMLLEARTATASVLARLLEAEDDEWEDVDDDDEEEWDDVANGEHCEDVDDEDEWEDIDDEEDDEELEDVENASSNSSIFLSSFLSNNPPTKDYPPIGHLSFTTISEARTAYYSMLSQVENLLVKWYHRDDVTALVKTLIESAQASYAEQEEFWKDRRIVQEWFGGIDG